MPAGLRKYNEQGEELFHTLQKACYGLSLSSKARAEELQGWMMKEFNQAGWTYAEERTQGDSTTHSSGYRRNIGAALARPVRVFKPSRASDGWPSF
jgi:hypothetical protein